MRRTSLFSPRPACTQKEPIDYYTAYPPLSLRTEGEGQKTVWGARQESVRYTVYYQGQPLALPQVGPTPHPRFSWRQRLPGGRLLLGLRPASDSAQNTYTFRLFLLDAPGGQPHLQALGNSAMENAELNPLAPRVWLTADSLGLLIGGAAASAPTPPNPPYRFVDLHEAGTFTPLPAGPACADGPPLELRRVAWSPDHQLLALSYQPDPASGPAVREVFDRRTGRRQPASRFPGATDTTGPAARPLPVR